MSSIARDSSFDLLRFPLAIIILIVHVFSVTGVRTISGITNVPSFPVVQGFVDAFIRGHSVPIFFFISGYVFFLGKNLTYTTYVQKIKKRIKSLLLPYVFWNLIALIIIVLIELIRSNCELNIRLEPYSFFSCFWKYDGSIIDKVNNLGLPINGPSWYVRDLMVVILFAPVLNFLLKNRAGVVTIIALLVLYICTNCGLKIELPMTAILFFSTGAYFSLNHNLNHIIDVKYVSLSVYLGISIICYIYSDMLSDVCYGVLFSLKIFWGVALAYAVAHQLTKAGYKANPFLSSASFFIYMSHGIIYGLVLKSLCIILSPNTTWELFAVYVASCILIILFLLGLYYLIKKYSAFLSVVLLGGR